MPIDPADLNQVLSTPESEDVTEKPLVRAVILNEPANAAALVPALGDGGALKAANARRILCQFPPDAAPFLLSALRTSSADVLMEGLEIFWALLVSQDELTVRRILGVAKPDLDVLLTDTRALPDDIPDYVERDFCGRICDLTYLVVQELMDREFNESLFRSSDDHDRDEAIRLLRANSFGFGIV